MKNLLRKNLTEDQFNALSARQKLIYTKRYYHTEKTKTGITPFRLISYLLKKYVGQSIDLVYSDFCKKTNYFQRRYFWYAFDYSNKYNRSINFYNGRYIIDEDKIIHFCSKKSVRKYRLRSSDYFVGYKLKTQYFSLLYSETISIERYNRLSSLDKERYYFVSQGWIKDYSKHDKEYQRRTHEYMREKRLNSKRNKKLLLQKQYSFLSDREKQSEIDKKINRIKIEAKGFDYYTSFRNEKQISSELIKEKQGFNH